MTRDQILLASWIGEVHEARRWRHVPDCDGLLIVVKYYLDGCWTVTHRPTGLAFPGDYDTPERALQAASHLATAYPREQLAQADKAKVIGNLSRRQVVAMLSGNFPFSG